MRLKFGPDSFGHGLEFVVRQLQLGVGEEHVFFALHRDQVDMGMGNFQSQHGLAHFSAGECSPDGQCHPFGEYLHGGQVVIGQVEEVVYFLFGYDQRVAFYQGVDVEEGKEAIVFRNLVAGNFACNDSAE